MGCSCSESRPGSCSLELGLEELSSSNKQGMLWVVCPDAAETAGRPACSLPGCSIPLPGPEGFCSFPQGGVGLAEFFGVNPKSSP